MKNANSSMSSAAASVRGYPWLKIAGCCALLLVVLATVKLSLNVMQDPAIFPITDVIVDGDLVYLERQDVIEVIAPEVKRGFFKLELDQLTYSLESLPWVKAVSLRRVWPEALMVEVVEQRAFAYWGDDGLVSVGGEAFFPDLTRRPEGLPSFIGPKGSAYEMTVFYRKLTDVFMQSGLNVSKLSLDNRRAWDVELGNGLLLKLGRVKGVERIQRFLKVYSGVVGGRVSEVDYVDLRYPNGFSIQWQDRVGGKGEQ